MYSKFRISRVPARVEVNDRDSGLVGSLCRFLRPRHEDCPTRLMNLQAIEDGVKGVGVREHVTYRARPWNCNIN